MSQQIINTGTAPNDATGDPLQVAFNKCNANFTALYTQPASKVFAATNGQTVFPLTTPGNVLLVILDGVVMVPGVDFTLSASQITLTSGALTGQTLYVIAI